MEKLKAEEIKELKNDYSRQMNKI